MDLVYLILSYVLAAAYLLAPAVAVGVGYRRGTLAGVTLTLAAGLVIGIGLTGVYAYALRAPLPVGQALLAGYLGGGLLVVLKAFDAGLWWLLAGPEPGRKRAVVAAVARVAVLVVVVLPVVMAVLMVYRPKPLPRVDPARELGIAFEAVEYSAADGSRVAAWWLPNPAGRGETVLLVHGLGGGKADILPMAGVLHQAGYAVLVPDLRAHGGSGGQLTSFGDHERHDVVGSLDWLAATHPADAEVVHGVGASMGAAALAASGDPRLDRLVLIGSFDDLGRLADAAVGRIFLWPFDAVARAVALPAASAHVGADLPAFAPAEHLPDAWPRPVMVVHAEDDEMIPFERGAALYQAAAEPKRQWFPPDGSHNAILRQPETIREVLTFLEADRPAALVGAL